MPARGNKEQDILASIIKNRCDDGDIGKMRSAIIGIVQNKGVASINITLITADNGAN